MHRCYVIRFHNHVNSLDVLETRVNEYEATMNHGGYNVAANNCQHFAIYVCTGIRFSPAVVTGVQVIADMVGHSTSKLGNASSRSSSSGGGHHGA